MKQVAQRPRDGCIVVVETPEPQLRPGWVLVRNAVSIISAGTERAKVEMGRKNLMEKARARPDLVRQVTARARTEGLRATAGAVKERLDALAPLGYSSAGIVVRVGAGVEGLKPGDAVACGGAGWANHAELVAVPRMLAVRVPAAVPLDAAAYATVGAIALHGVRQAEAAVGERVGVIGLGLVGQLAVRLLGAAGCTPIGIDLDPAAITLAQAGGARGYRRDDPELERGILEVTGGLGLDSVIVCAAAATSDPIELAARLARDRGRLVVVGDVEVAADRALLYDKELELRLSRSYGPGRYDRDYEERGRDLPAGYVRWTEQRNLEAFLELVAAGRLDPRDLTTHRFAVEDAEQAYAVLTSGSEQRPFGVLLEYSAEAEPAPAPEQRPRKRRPERPRVGLIGAGAFAPRVLVPALRAGGAELVAATTQGGLSAADVVSRFGFDRAADSPEDVLDDPSIDAVVIATRHADHARLATAALQGGKHVFVEKPLALEEEGVAAVERALAGSGLTLMVGFNRRFAPLVERLKASWPSGPRLLVVRVNAGPLPVGHWLNDIEDGGGRLVGEGCHFVDLITHLTAARIARVYAAASGQPAGPLEAADDIVATVELDSGATASLVYTGSGDSRLPKERIEAYGGGRAAVLDDFRRLELYAAGRRTLVKSRQDKGHAAQIGRFLDAVAGRAPSPPAAGYLHSSLATLALVESLRAGLPVSV